MSAGGSYHPQEIVEQLSSMFKDIADVNRRIDVVEFEVRRNLPLKTLQDIHEEICGLRNDLAGERCEARNRL